MRTKASGAPSLPPRLDKPVQSAIGSDSQGQLEGNAAESGPTATPAPHDAVPAQTGSDSQNHHRPSAAELAAIEESKRELELKLISSFAQKLGDSVALAKACEKALTDSLDSVARASAAQAASAPRAVVSKGNKDSVNISQSKASASSGAAASPKTRQSAALSLSSFGLKSAAPDADDDLAFDETKTPDAPILKYGRNGVPELRQVIHCAALESRAVLTFLQLTLSDDNRFLMWKGRKGGQCNVDVSCLTLCIVFFF